ncbi:MAG: ribose-phosphate pyrophosphokinase [Oscillospiraceae bacterium]|nr:ribose-phosphate pyrophosphokinase [Oscillospiraceae bacterium]
MTFETKPIVEFSNVPVGPIGLICLQGATELGKQIDDELKNRRIENIDDNPDLLAFPEVYKDTYIIEHNCLRFSNGEGKAVLNSSARGKDIFILVDIGNYSCTFKMFNMDVPMSPDDHYQDLKRVISSLSGKARRINLIMPMLYEARQHWRNSRESLDCAHALQELEALGVKNILTFDAHDPRVQNAIPLTGFENFHPAYQMIKAMINEVKDIDFDKEHLMVISPDEGGMKRSLYYASVLGVDLATFYKRRDYTIVINGRNPIVAHEFLGDSVLGKDVLIVEDVIATGESMLDVATSLKERGAKRVFVAVTFSLFTNGIDAFNDAYRNGIINKVFSTNLTYRTKELLEAPWYCDVNMSKFISYLIDTINNDTSLNDLVKPFYKISTALERHRKERVSL